MRLRWAAPVAFALFMLAGCGSSTAINATPQITGLFPPQITAGSQAFTVFVSGTQFISTSTVQWNGSNRATSFNAATTQLSASITAADVQNPGIASVTVTSPAPGGGVSVAMSFAVSPAQSGGPTITSISPASAAVNSLGFTLMVTGTNFLSTDYVTWNGGLRSTTFTSATQLSAAIPATDLTQQMTASVAVHTSQLNQASPSVSFQVGSSTSSAVVPELISVNAMGGAADGASSWPTVSGDGRFVVFRSEAKNLVASGASGNIFVRDSCLGASACTARTIAVDLAPDGSAPNGGASAPAMSGDGRYVAFSSRATNLVGDVLAGQAQVARVFVRDTCLGNSALANCAPHTELVSIDAGGQAVTGDQVAMSGDGRFVAFVAKKQVLVRDTCHGAEAGCNPRTTVASVDEAGAIPAVSWNVPSISQTGRYVAFAGFAASPAAKQGVPQIFLRDTCAETAVEGCMPSTVRVSVTPDRGFGDAGSESPSVSADGRFVVFESGASNLTFEHSTREDVYLRDTCLSPTAQPDCSPWTTRVSTDAGLGGDSLANYSPAISPSGRYVSYTAETSRDSAAEPLGVGNLIVVDTCFGVVAACYSGPAAALMPNGTLLPVVFTNASHEVPLTPDGRFVVFSTREALTATPTSGLGDVYLTASPFQSKQR